MSLSDISTTISLDLYDHDLTPSKIKAIALDSKTRYVNAQLTKGGQQYDIGQSTAVTLTIIRPDKTGVQVTGATYSYLVYIDGTETTVYGARAELTQTALAVSGTLQAQFMFTSGGQILRSEIFTINNGIALDSTVSEWAGEYQGYNLDELVQNVNESSAKVDAMEQDVTELKEGFNALEDALIVTGSVTGSEFIIKARFEQNGLMNQNDSWRMFSFDINASEYSKITVHTGMQSRGSITIPMIVFYKKPVSYITDTTWNTLTTADVAGTGEIYPTGVAQEVTETLNVPEGTQSCFVCIGIDYYNNDMRPSVTFSNPIDVHAVEGTANSAYAMAQDNELDISTIKQNLNVENELDSEYIMKCRFNQDGTLEWNASWRMYKFDVTNVSKVTVHTGMQSRGSITIPMVVFFDKEASYITDATWNTLTTSDVVGIGTVYPTGGAQEVTEVLTVPTGAKSMLVSIGIDYYNNGMLPTAIYEAMADITALMVALDVNYQYAVDKVLCIGDSLTEGAYFGNDWADSPSAGSAIEQCYPNYLSRMLSCSVTNGGISGDSASDWYSNEISKYTLADYDTFIIWLGTNLGLEGTLGTAYTSIIDDIKTANPDAFIVLMTIFAGGGGNVSGTNSIITSVAEAKGCKVIDMSDLSPVKKPHLHDDIDNPHFSKAGNIFVADRICSKLKEIFNESPKLTEFGISQGTRGAVYTH